MCLYIYKYVYIYIFIHTHTNLLHPLGESLEHQSSWSAGPPCCSQTWTPNTTVSFMTNIPCIFLWGTRQLPYPII